MSKNSYRQLVVVLQKSSNISGIIMQTSNLGVLYSSSQSIQVSEKHTPLKKTTRGRTSSQSTQSGAGEQFLPLDIGANARRKGVVFSQTPVVKGVIVKLELSHPKVSLHTTRVTRSRAERSAGLRETWHSDTKARAC